MSFLEFEHAVLPRIVVPLIAGLMLAGALRGPAQAGDSNTFVIADSEGYGITECLSSGKACGRIVADAWCEAHGMGQAMAFGPASDITGSTKPTQVAALAPAATSITPGSVVVTCGQ